MFDLNFVPSFQALLDRGYISMIEAVLPETPEIAAAVKQAHAHVQKFTAGPAPNSTLRVLS
ncbi:MAG: hypothetical protein JRI38_03835 [Deltaproteobacteria bacterium]|nr:hypothetical protein [Deltaproteobacteria bacterium]